MDQDRFEFKYCQKLVIFSKDLEKVLLCKRRDEEYFNEIYTFTGGKMETTDESIIAAIKREKDEEIGKNFKIVLYPKVSQNIYFKEKDKNFFMILPHYFAQHISGEVDLNKREYSGYKWVDIKALDNFEPKIKNIPETVNYFLSIRKIIKKEDLIII